MVAPSSRLFQFSLDSLTKVTHNWHDEIGSGVTGRVYRGEAAFGPGQLAVAIAVKRLRSIPTGASPEFAAALDRAFRAELETLSALQHVNIVRLLGYANDPGGVALVFELLTGGSLACHLRASNASVAPIGTPLDAATRLNIAIGIARGIAYLHGLYEDGDEAGAARTPVLHRDIKSANVGLDAMFVPKIIDCGLSRFFGRSAATHADVAQGATLQTVTGGTLTGTPGYTAPEIVRGHYGIASEIFSLGVVLFELYTGVCVSPDALANARNGVEDADVGHLHALVDPVWPAPLVVPVAALILHCTEPRPERRPKSAREVFERLIAFRAHSSSLAPSPLLNCVICRDEFDSTAGVLCKSDEATSHFLCQGCLNPYIPMCLEPSRLRVHEGAIPCPGRGPGVAAVPCNAVPWDFSDLRSFLSTDTTVALVGALQGFVGTLLASEADAVAARATAVAARDAEVAAATAQADRAARVAALRVRFVDEHLTLRCPRCRQAFIDYDGCDAVRCERCGAGFCALCLADCGADAHKHVAQANHARVLDGNMRVYSTVEARRAIHAELRLRKMCTAIAELPDSPAVKVALIDAMKRDLADVGIDKEALHRSTCVAQIPGTMRADRLPPPASRAGGTLGNDEQRRAATDCIAGDACHLKATCSFRHVPPHLSGVYCTDWVVYRAAGAPFCPRGQACPWAHPHHKAVRLTDCPACTAGARGGRSNPCAYTGGLPSLLRHAGRAHGRVCPVFSPPPYGSECPRAFSCPDAHVMCPWSPEDGGY